MAEGEDGDEDLWDLDFEDDFISEGSLDSVEGPEEDDAGSDSSQTLRSDPDFAYCGTSWLDKEDRYRRSIQIELQRAKCYHTVAHINYRQSPTNSRSRKELAKASRGFYRGHGAKYQMAGNRPQTRAGWECPEDREKAEEVLSISARKLFNLTSALNDWDRLTGDKAATLTLGVAAKTIDHSIVTRATQGEDCSKAALTDDVNLSKKKTPKSIEARPATRPNNARKRLARKKSVGS
ncbi:hypothetical protein EMCRGX_G027136 [Ephydatia muelleri]